MTRTALSLPPPPPLKVEADVCYPLADFARSFRFGKKAMREARRRGLPVHYLGRNGFVFGSDFHAYLREHGKDSR